MITCSKAELDDDVAIVVYKPHLTYKQVFDKAHYMVSTMYDDLNHHRFNDLCIASYWEFAADEDTFPKKANGHTEATGLYWRDSHIAETVLLNFRRNVFNRYVKAVFMFRDLEEYKSLYKVFDIISNKLHFRPGVAPVLFKVCKRCNSIKQYGTGLATKPYQKAHWIEDTSE